MRGDPIPVPSFYFLHRKEGEANQVILLVGIPNLVKDLQKIALENFVENFGVVAIPGEDPEISREQGARYFKPLNEDDPEDDQRRGLKNYLKDSLGKLVHGVYNLIRNVPEKAAIKLGLYHAPIYEHPEKMTEKGKAVYYTENKYTPTSAELFSRFGGDARLTAWTASAATAFYQIVDIYLHGSDRPSDVYSYSAVLIGLSYLAATAMDLPERLSAKLKERGGWPRRHTPLKVLRALFGYESRKRNSSVVFSAPKIAKQVVQKIIPELKMEDGDYAPLILIVDKNTVANLGYELVLQSKEEAKYNFLPVKID